MLRKVFLVVACAAAAGCGGTSPLDKALPTIESTGGAPTVFAGQITMATYATEKIAGPAAQGKPGDYFLRNDKIRVIVQAPGTNVGPCAFGGNIIDVDRVADPAGDQLGEISPFLQLGRTFVWGEPQIVADGSKGGPAAIRFFGHDAKIDYIDLPNIGSFAGIIPQEYRAKIPLGLQAAVTYVLAPGESRVRAIFTMHNPTKVDVITTWGTLSDTGSNIEVYHPYNGFGEVGFDDILSTTDAPPGHYSAFHGQGITYGIMPVYDAPTKAGTGLAVAGVNVDVYEIGQVVDAFGEQGQSLRLPSGAVVTREWQLLVETDVAAVTARVATIRGEATSPVSGSVTDAMGAAVGNARVLAIDTAKTGAAAIATTFSTRADGTFAGALPAGTYQLTAEGPNFVRSAPSTVTLPATAPITLALPAMAKLRYTIKGRDGVAMPAKISVVGAPASTPDRRFRDVGADSLPHGIAAYRLSFAGDSSAPNGFDAPIPLAPGRYRVVITRGPEWSRVMQVIDLPAEGAQIDAVLDRIIPTPGYVATDFHQHSYFSPDSTVPPELKVVGYLAEGVEFISSSDHDTLYDYEPLLDQLGVSSELDSSVGVETTPWDYGHFIAFPLPYDPSSPTGGAPDWSGGENGFALPPDDLFTQFRQLGAKVVEVNHPRTPSRTNFQNNFDRAGLRFDFAARTFYGDVALQEFDAVTLGMPPDGKVFGANFDALEIFNGFSAGPADADGERIDQKVELILHDWMNFLSFGFTPTPVGNSDSHSIFNAPQGLPRSYVRVPDDSKAAIAAGLADDVTATVAGMGKPRDVIVSNTPFVQFTVDGMGIGSTVAHPGGPLQLHIEVKTPAWAPIDTVEVFANETVDVPSATPRRLMPALCFTSRATPSSRCTAAIGGARPLSLSTVEVVAGQPQTARLEATIDLSIEASELLARQRVGAQGQDLWLVVRTFGDVGLFPMVPDSVSSRTAAELVETFDLVGIGQPALAFTNAIFVDVDGGGWKAPFAP